MNQQFGDHTKLVSSLVREAGHEATRQQLGMLLALLDQGLLPKKLNQWSGRRGVLRQNGGAAPAAPLPAAFGTPRSRTVGTRRYYYMVAPFFLKIHLACQRTRKCAGRPHFGRSFYIEKFKQ